MVNTVYKSIRILNLLAESGDLGITEISKRLELPKSSVHNILATLEAEGVVERHADNHRYHLGVKLIELGNRAQNEVDICRIARPHLRLLNDQTDETVHLTILDADEVLYVDCVESKKRLRTYSVIGVRAPLYCTSVGKAILAFQPPAEIDRIVTSYPMTRFTDTTITSPDVLRAELQGIRKQGFAIDNMEHEDHIRCVGVPIFGVGSRVTASISVSGPAQRVTMEAVPELAERTVATASEISRKLGHVT